MFSTFKRAGRTFAIVRVIGLILLIASVMAIFAKYGVDWRRIEADFFTNGISELLGLVFTVLVIDGMNERRANRREKRALILQMGSPDAGFAIEAVRILRAQGWLTDESLRHALLHGANLEGAKLFSARLCDASLREANLQGANLDRADLTGAFLSEANLQGASLREANLQGATFTNANLKGASFTKANLQGTFLTGADLTGATISEEQLRQCASLKDATLPDGIRYDGRFDAAGG